MFSSPLSEHIYVDFWVTWESGIIQVGQGVILGQNVFMTWNDPHPETISIIGIATGWGSSGDWIPYAGMKSQTATLPMAFENSFYAINISHEICAILQVIYSDFE